MPSRYQIARRDSSSSSGSEFSEDSDRSQSTAPTVYSEALSSKFQQIPLGKYEPDNSWDGFYGGGWDARSSDVTYASTVYSDEEPVEDFTPYDEPEYGYEAFTPSAVPSTPTEFAECFPSTRRLCIRHDDTVDGNMNLRIDTEIQAAGRKLDLTLFHLRMHDLKNRDFSLRRYCRESGREVCHSSRKYTKPAIDRRPGLQRSMSNALASFRSKSESKADTFQGLKRHDSGYDSMSDDDVAEVEMKRSSPKESSNTIPLPTNTTKLEFSNYAHIDIKRRGATTSKRYEFEYWGTAYAWKRIAKKNGTRKEVSYHLLNTETSASVAHIVPTPMTPQETEEEDRKGGWVPPCSMWISDQRIISRCTDVADVIVATGLLALVDDCIKSRWHRKDRFHIPIPMPMLSARKMNMEYVGPKRLINEVFNRRGNTATRHLTPLRQNAAKA